MARFFTYLAQFLMPGKGHRISSSKIWIRCCATMPWPRNLPRALRAAFWTSRIGWRVNHFGFSSATFPCPYFENRSHQSLAIMPAMKFTTHNLLHLKSRSSRFSDSSGFFYSWPLLHLSYTYQWVPSPGRISSSSSTWNPDTLTHWRGLHSKKLAPDDAFGLIFIKFTVCCLKQDAHPSDKSVESTVEHLYGDRKRCALNVPRYKFSDTINPPWWAGRSASLIVLVDWSRTDPPGFLQNNHQIRAALQRQPLALRFQHFRHTVFICFFLVLCNTWYENITCDSNLLFMDVFF